MQAAEQLVAVDEVFRQDQKRPVHWYQIPKLLAAESGIAKIGIVELTAGEELMATKRATNQVTLAFELAKECLWFVNDKRVSTADGTCDEFWSRRAPMMAHIRQLVITAMNAVQVPKQEDVTDFLASKTIQVR